MGRSALMSLAAHVGGWGPLNVGKVSDEATRDFLNFIFHI